MTIYSLDILLFLFGTSLLFHVLDPFGCYFDYEHRCFFQSFLPSGVHGVSSSTVAGLSGSSLDAEATAETQGLWLLVSYRTLHTGSR